MFHVRVSSLARARLVIQTEQATLEVGRREGCEWAGVSVRCVEEERSTRRLEAASGEGYQFRGLTLTRVSIFFSMLLLPVYSSHPRSSTFHNAASAAYGHRHQGWVYEQDGDGDSVAVEDSCKDVEGV